jgi:hypothetical protein
MIDSYLKGFYYLTIFVFVSNKASDIIKARFDFLYNFNLDVRIQNFYFNLINKARTHIFIIFHRVYYKLKFLLKVSNSLV